MVKVFQGLESKPAIYVCLPCPVPPSGLAGINEAEVKKEVPLIQQLAREMNLKVIDMHAALKGKPRLQPDKVHPGTEDATELARTAYRALNGQASTECPSPSLTFRRRRSRPRRHPGALTATAG